MIILDTNVLSELMRPKPSPGVVLAVIRRKACQSWIAIVLFRAVRNWRSSVSGQDTHSTILLK